MLRRKSKIIKERQNMSTQFAWLTTILIAIVSLLIAVSVLSFFNQIMLEMNHKNKERELFISSKIFDTVQEKYDSENSKVLTDILIPSLQDELIAYVTIKDRKANRIIYSIDGKRKFKKVNLEYQDYAPEYISKKYAVIVGFYERSSFNKYINDFLVKLSLLTIACIFFGLLMSYFMFKIVNKPLEELIKSAQKFKHGNFTTHLEKSHYEEINRLVDTYNSMGDSLNELYTSLEMKVEERTVELRKAYKELQETQTMIVHSEKMRSLGELVAGITHEINNPINFIYGNLVHLRNYSDDLVNLINEMSEVSKEKTEKDKINDLKKHYDFEFIKEDLPLLIKSCLEGADRTKNIIMDLKNFSRMGENITSSIDLSAEIDTTLNILHNKLKNRINIIKDYQENLPKIDAFGGQLNQVFMNIIDNATYAIKEKGNIKISMHYDEKYVTIKIEDDGCGMDKETAKRIFDPFYTTKPVGEGTGLGMSISYKIVKNHSGDISVESEEGKGTVFTIVLPIVNNEITKGV